MTARRMSSAEFDDMIERRRAELDEEGLSTGQGHKPVKRARAVEDASEAARSAASATAPEVAAAGAAAKAARSAASSAKSATVGVARTAWKSTAPGNPAAGGMAVRVVRGLLAGAILLEVLALATHRNFNFQLGGRTGSNIPQSPLGTRQSAYQPLYPDQNTAAILASADQIINHDTGAIPTASPSVGSTSGPVVAA